MSRTDWVVLAAPLCYDVAGRGSVHFICLQEMPVLETVKEKLGTCHLHAGRMRDMGKAHTNLPNVSEAN